MKKICKLTILLSIILTFNACKKDSALQEVKNTDLTEQKILNFKAQMQNPNKSNESMSIDSAVWYIEAALNYTYCIVSQEQIGNGFNFNILKDSTTVNTNAQNNVISFQEVSGIYSQLNTILLNRLNTLDYENQFINIVDINYKDHTFKAKYSIKFAETSQNGNKYLYNISDRWYPGFDNGNCSQIVPNRDLTDEIEKWLSYNRAVLANVYYTDIEWEGILYSYPPEIQDIWYEDQPPSWCHNIYSYYDHIEFYFDSFESDVYVSLKDRFKHTCPEVAYENYCAEEINQGIFWAEEYLLGPGRVITGWDVMEASAERDIDYGTHYHYYYYQMHREYIYSGIPHSSGSQER